MAQQQDAEVASDSHSLTDEVESRLREYLSRSDSEYPAGSEADWLAKNVTERLSGTDPDAGTAAISAVSLVKLSIYLMESLSDVSNTYEEFYAQQITELRDDGLAAHAQVAALEDENARLREQLHRRAEELREAQATATALKTAAAASSATASEGGLAGRHRFDEAVDVEGDDDDDTDVDERDVAEDRDAVCRRCGRGGRDVSEAEASAAAAATAAAVQIAALKADLADWEADMAEKVHQNVELAAQLEACQRQLARQAATRTATSAADSVAAPAPRGIFSGMPLLRKKN